MKSPSWAGAAMVSGLMMFPFVAFESASGVTAYIKDKSETEHGERLWEQVKAVIQTSPTARTEGEAYIYILDEGRHLSMTEDGDVMDPKWDLVCGTKGEDHVLMALDDGAGTPVDWNRQVLMAQNKGEPLTIFFDPDDYISLAMGVIDELSGQTIKPYWVNNDGEALSVLKRKGTGLALIEERNAHARGYSIALYLSGEGTADIPSAPSLGVTTITGRFAGVYIDKSGSDSLLPVIQEGCDYRPELALSAEAVKAKLDVLTGLQRNKEAEQ